MDLELFRTLLHLELLRTFWNLKLMSSNFTIMSIGALPFPILYFMPPTLQSSYKVKQLKRAFRKEKRFEAFWSFCSTRRRGCYPLGSCSIVPDESIRVANRSHGFSVPLEFTSHTAPDFDRFTGPILRNFSGCTISKVHV